MIGAYVTIAGGAAYVVNGELRFFIEEDEIVLVVSNETFHWSDKFFKDANGPYVNRSFLVCYCRQHGMDDTQASTAFTSPG